MGFWKIRLSSIMREPLLQFLIAGGLLVAAHRLYVGISRPVIEVTPEWAETLARDFEVKSGHPPDPADRKELIRDYVESEILYREAKKQGMVEDPRVRRLMLLVQREIMEPVVPDPSDAELEKMRQTEPEAFHFPAEIRFEHASFTTAAEIPDGELEALRGGGKAVSPEAMRLPNPMPKTWLPQIEKMFGKDFAAAVSKCKPGEWNGPFKSALGVHFVKVLEYTPSREMPMSQVRSALVSRWTSDRKKAAVTDKVTELARDYRIILPSEP
jgi:hypothetical protein